MSGDILHEVENLRLGISSTASDFSSDLLLKNSFIISDSTNIDLNISKKLVS